VTSRPPTKPCAQIQNLAIFGGLGIDRSSLTEETTLPTDSFCQSAGSVGSQNLSRWSDDIRVDFRDNSHNLSIGSKILSVNDRVRVWSIELQSGERLGAHRHTLDYFWTALTAGQGRQHVGDGSVRDITYEAGETRHFSFGAGEYILHDLQNIGDRPLSFLTVELLSHGDGHHGQLRQVTEENSP
jgi:hypothetical protein